MNTWGLLMRPRAISSRRRMPAVGARGLVFPLGQADRLEQLGRRLPAILAVPCCGSARAARLSDAGRSPSTVFACGITPISLRTRAVRRSTSYPITSAFPDVGRISVVSMRMRVLFPAPFGPRIPKISPCLTLKLRSSSAVKSPNFFVRCSTRIAGPPPAIMVAADAVESVSAEGTAFIAAPRPVPTRSEEW